MFDLKLLEYGAYISGCFMLQNIVIEKRPKMCV